MQTHVEEAKGRWHVWAWSGDTVHHRVCARESEAELWRARMSHDSRSCKTFGEAARRVAMSSQVLLAASRDPIRSALERRVFAKQAQRAIRMLERLEREPKSKPFGDRWWVTECTEEGCERITRAPAFLVWESRSGEFPRCTEHHLRWPGVRASEPDVSRVAEIVEIERKLLDADFSTQAHDAEIAAGEWSDLLLRRMTLLSSVDADALDTARREAGLFDRDLSEPAPQQPQPSRPDRAPAVRRTETDWDI